MKMSSKKELETLFKYFLLGFAIISLAVNWHNVKLLFLCFDYRSVSARISNIFEPSWIKDYNLILEKDIIKIPKLNIEAPIVFLDTNSTDFDKALKRGVLFYPNSAMPGEKGVSIILGHSAPPNWPKGTFESVFSNLGQLKNGALIRLRFNGKIYDYRVTGKYFLNKGEEISRLNIHKEKSVLILLSCWPPGKITKE